MKAQIYIAQKPVYNTSFEEQNYLFYELILDEEVIVASKSPLRQSDDLAIPATYIAKILKRREVKKYDLHNGTLIKQTKNYKDEIDPDYVSTKDIIQFTQTLDKLLKNI